MFENKKIFILGMARSGFEVAKLLSKHHNQIFITDAKDQDPNQIKELQSLGVTYKTDNEPETILDETYDYVIKNPGIRKDHPCVTKAHTLGTPVINELEVAYAFLPKNVYIIGVTGSNGKTTTTTMIYDILKKAGKKVYLAGNIGIPLSKMVSDIEENSMLVIEISDHQLLDMSQFKTNISILTNLSEVHLDFHGNYENYKNVKKKIFNHHTQEDLAILNADNEDSLALTMDIPSTKKYFSSKQRSDASLENGFICIEGEKVLEIEEIKLKGNHNYENIMCALLVLKKLDIPYTYAEEYLKDFGGVEHRMEYVTEFQKIKFYNDSKSTNTESTITALKAFENPTILILGGYDRGHSFDPLIPYLGNVKEILCYGETKDRIESFAKEQDIPCKKVENLIEATQESYKSAEEGDIVLLSPACASWDQYKCFEDRGSEFKETIKQIERGK